MLLCDDATDATISLERIGKLPHVPEKT